MRGGTVEGIVGEVLGRQGGMAYRKGGSVYTYAPNFFGGNESLGRMCLWVQV